MADSFSSRRFSGGHRSAFSQTCNLLSQYVKEKKTIGDLSLGMLGNGDERGQNDAFRPSMMNLFPVNKKPTEEGQVLSDGKSMDLFPQQAGLASQSSEQKSSELTIFYGGQVIVFNDFPPHKAKEIMELAKRGVSKTSTNDTIPNSTSPEMKKNVLNNSNKQVVQESAQQPKTSIVTDLPIARKASLHRFLEKRKDRIKARAPYNTSKAGDDLPLKAADESNPWLGLAAVPPS